MKQFTNQALNEQSLIRHAYYDDMLKMDAIMDAFEFQTEGFRRPRQQLKNFEFQINCSTQDKTELFAKVLELLGNYGNGLTFTVNTMNPKTSFIHCMVGKIEFSISVKENGGGLIVRRIKVAPNQHIWKEIKEVLTLLLGDL